VVDQAQLQVK